MQEYFYIEIQAAHVYAGGIAGRDTRQPVPVTSVL